MAYLVSIYRKTEARNVPATFDTVPGQELAFWYSVGLDWIDELVRDGKAISLGGDAYPSRYTITLANFLPEIAKGPPSSGSRRTSAPGDDAYPSGSAITFATLFPELAKRRPTKGRRKRSAPDDEALPPDEEAWTGSSRIDRAALAECSMDEWLLVDSYDST